MAAVNEECATISQLWIYPIKACRGTQVQSAETTATGGFALDRAWCVLDYRGDRYPEREYISQRKIAKMATINPRFSDDRSELIITAPGMPELTVPVAEEAYLNDDAAHERVTVNCCGKSTTTGAGWQLGEMEGRSAGAAAEAWFTEYLNRADHKANKPQARYLLVRSIGASTRQVSKHGDFDKATGQGIPGLALPDYQNRVRPGDRIRFQDFAPFLLTNESSIADLNGQMGTQSYSLRCFRPSIVVQDTGGDAWAEESWLRVGVGIGGGGEELELVKIKECPRCTVPTRDQDTGEYVFKTKEFEGVKGGLLHATATLKKTFPHKAADDEWGTWKGAFFGVYFGHDGREATVKVGDKVRLLETDAHQQRVERANPRTDRPSGAALSAQHLVLLAVAVFVLNFAWALRSRLLKLEL